MDKFKILLSGGRIGIANKQRWAWRKEVERELGDFRWEVK